MSGVVIFLAHHEWYHIGQVSYVRCILAACRIALLIAGPASMQ